MKLWFTMENYGTMEKTMVLWSKLYGTIPRTMELRFTKEKKHGRLPKTKKLWFIMEKKNYGNTPK